MRYSKYACHELHFFLYHKDPEFFRTVVQPYLKNKMDKQFLDHLPPSPMALNSVWEQRSASVLKSCMPAAQWHSKS